MLAVYINIFVRLEILHFSLENSIPKTIVGIIIFIKESDLNLQELSSTINYILSRGYKIVNIDKLLS